VVVLNTFSPQRRIAVIDDDAVFLELMHDLLAIGEGYDVVTNPDWVDTLEFVKRSQPDLIMLDLMLGRAQAGWAVLEVLAAHEETRCIPVILCSAAAPALDHRPNRTQSLPNVVALAKPFDVDQLLATIEQLLTNTGVTAS
jgi:CheY-like chemotaxis protein